VKGKKILYGLKGIKNVGAGAVSRITQERDENGKFTDIWDFCKRMDSKSVNKAVIESLTAAGAFDELAGSRAQNYAVIQKAIDFGARIQLEKSRGQLTLFDDFASEENDAITPKLPGVEEWGFKERLEREKEVLGFYWSGHPLDKHKYLIKSIINFEAENYDSENCSIPANLVMCGLVNKVEIKRARRDNKPFAVLKLEDMTGKFESTLFSNNFERYAITLKPGSLVLIMGKNSSRDDKILSVSPDRIFELNTLLQKISGVLQIQADQENLNGELSSLINDHCDPQEHIKLEMIIKTNEFNTLMCKTTRKVKITEEFLQEITRITGNHPKFILN
jgi:DNA polymerase-3 subunit alpha